MRFIIVCMCVVGLLGLCACAWAGVSGPLTVKATSAGKSATWTYNWVPGVMSYQLGAPIELRTSDNTLVGKVNSLNCAMGSDPFLTLNFAVQAVGNTNFTFDSGLLIFAPISPAEAFATAATTLTADGGGATFTGNFAGNNAYEATYNFGSVFADLNTTFSAPPNTSATENDRLPASGFGPIAGPVVTMRTQWNFNLTDGDGASGTSRFELQPAVPDANTLSLAFAGAAPLLAGIIRRRRRA